MRKRVRFKKGKRKFSRRRYSRFKRRINSDRVLVKQRFTRDVSCDGAGDYYMQIRLMDPEVPWQDINTSATVAISDFPSYQNCYDAYRVCGIKLQWIPNVVSTAAFDSTSPGLIGNMYKPMYSLIDYTENESNLINESAMMDYGTFKAHNLWRPWKRYFKVPKYSSNPSSTPNTDQAAVVGRGYFPTTPVNGEYPSNGYILLRTSGILPTSSSFGRLIVTYYVAYKHRK